MTQPEKQGDVPPAYTDLDAELIFGTPQPPPPESTRQPLQLPICLPQTTSGYDAPFARSYNTQIEASGIKQDEFLDFLDALNIAMVWTGQFVHAAKCYIIDIVSRRQALRCAWLTWPEWSSGLCECLYRTSKYSS
jgi:hypothetical protein